MNWTGLGTRQTSLWPSPLCPRKLREVKLTEFFAIRNSSFGLPQVRHSKFVNRHWPDPHDATGRFDFVRANPPFKVNAVDTAMRSSARRHHEGTPQNLPAKQDHVRLNAMVGPDRRVPVGLPHTDNAIDLPLLVKPSKTRVGVILFVVANFDLGC